MNEKKSAYDKVRNTMNYTQESLSLIEESIILAHSINLYLGLQCINR